MNDGTRERVRAHVQRLRDILEPMGHQVLDTSDRDQPDSLYSDYSHFNTSGAYAFSTYALGKLTK